MNIFNTYLQYINELISMSKIMNKRFYIIVPYDPLTDDRKNFFAMEVAIALLLLI